MKKITFKNWILLGISVSLTLVFVVGYSSYKSLQNVNEDQVWVNHTEKVINKFDDIIKIVIDAETGQRGFLLTKKEEFLEPYDNAINQVDQNLNDLDQLIIDNPVQVENSHKLRIFIQNRLKLIAEIIETKKDKDISNSELIKKLSLGKKQMDAIRYQVKKMTDIEDILLIKRTDSSEKSIRKAILIIFGGTALIFIIILILFKFIRSSFAKQIKSQEELNTTNIELEILFKNNEEKTWILSGTSDLREKIQGELSVDDMAKNIICNVAEYAKSQVAAIYLAEDNEEKFVLKAGYALNITSATKKIFNISETWVGQVAIGKKPVIIRGELIQNLDITSGLISTQPLESLIVPFYFNNKIKGLLELGFKEVISGKQKDFVSIASEVIGVAINTAQSRELLQSLFEETQLQSEELEVQQEELRVTNDELMNKTHMLQSSEEELRVQREELREINFELEEKARLLEEKNQLIEDAREAIVLKMQLLEQSGKYKSEFLANMSHELRTPLNSILILARILKDNKNNHLSDEEAKYANVIFKAGNDLLNLINDILDLAKIESGKVELNFEEVEVDEISDDLNQLFSEVAKNKDIEYTINVENTLPKKIITDKIRVEQILKNLLSNAFKFTPKNGKVTVDFNYLNADQQIKIDVIDTGIGIPEEKQSLVFEAFQQADGSTSREYGGTGLGLSICRELAHRMDGEITVKSVSGEGSIFSLTIPIQSKVSLENGVAEELVDRMLIESKNQLRTLKMQQSMKPDLKREKPLLLVVEDDVVFNDFLKDYGLNKGFEVIQVFDGENAINEAINQQPNAILLDIMLPGIDGWKVLKRLKSEENTKFIPVHMMSAGDQREKKALQSGALSFIKKPIDKDQLDHVFKSIIEPNNLDYKNILLVEDHHIQSDALAGLFRSKNIKVQQAFTGEETLNYLADNEYDCIILDINLPDISGVDLLEKIKSNEKYKDLPVVINTAMELDEEMLNKLLRYSNATIMKSEKSSDRLIDEVNLFLYKIKNDDLAKSPKGMNVNESQLKGKTILVVDDDMRNIFAITAILDDFGFSVEMANDGLEAIEKLNDNQAINLVLMDIMMPKMDGYEAMKAIRKKPQWQKLPIIALTAKAMKEDRDHCIAAGANDYITKPVDVDKLLALVKIWIT
nr:response regulator [Pseudopedobacter sp.]